MWQHVIVGLIVALAFAWAAWYWMPAAWRRGLAAAAGRGGRRLGLKDAGAARFARAVADAPGCSACDSCGSCATPGRPAGSPADARTVRIVASR
ncbi:hypothetical protein GN316_16410 [Xylophilus sp. Kf1]|nr:hypothetical protein [Xylophilus sp. Kf1]